MRKQISLPFSRLLQPLHRVTWLSLASTLLVCGTIVASADAHEPGKMPHPDNSAHDAHEHKKIEIPAGQPVPTVNLVVHPDPVSGWNLEVKVSNFRFAPEHLNSKSLSTEGHAHLYIDGKKVTRLYGSWYYLGNLAPGQHTITVTLNSNGHEELVHNNQPIQDTKIVQVK